MSNPARSPPQRELPAGMGGYPARSLAQRDLPRVWYPPRMTLLLLLACAHRAPEAAVRLPFPAALVDQVEVLAVADPDYARANVAAAVKPEGQGGVTSAVVVRLTADVPVYRLWNGPDHKDANGYTNRLGGWWTTDAPRGSVDDYRRDYEVCRKWNDLAWVATCTLQAGAVVAVGPGQSVSAALCGDEEAYPANPAAFQVYVDKPWTRGAELVCPAETEDYPADSADLSRRAP